MHYKRMRSSILTHSLSQDRDDELKQLSVTSLKLTRVPLPTSQGTIVCDTSTGTARPFVPNLFRRSVFEGNAEIDHSTVCVAGINHDIRHWTKTCQKCQQCKMQRHTKSPLGTFSTPDARFAHVHIDLVGPLPPSDGMTYSLVWIDSPAGQKPFRSLTSPLRRWLVHSLHIGSQGLVHHPPSPRTEVVSLSHGCSRRSLTC